MSNQVYDVTPETTSDDRLMALLSYIFPVIVPLIILLTEERKNRPFQRLHAVQSLVLSVIIAIATILVITSCLTPVIYIWGIVVGIKAYQGENLAIPFVSGFVKKQGWV